MPRDPWGPLPNKYPIMEGEAVIVSRCQREAPTHWLDEERRDLLVFIELMPDVPTIVPDYVADDLVERFDFPGTYQHVERLGVGEGDWPIVRVKRTTG
jgi:hypothetical protein